MRYFVKTVSMMLVLCIILTTFAIPANAAATVPAKEQEKTVYEEVPLYYQNDYPNTPYGHGTVASSGCGITCLAMVASYLLDEEILPDELAKEYGKYVASNMDRMEHAANSMDIPHYDKLYSWEDVLSALGNDKVVITLMGTGSIFTDSQHFVVLTEITPDGKIMVNDPNKSNYGLWNLKDGFENGFNQRVVSVGFAGGWAFEKENKATAEKSEDAAEPVPVNANGIEIPQTFDTVPTYFQTDYSNVRFGTGTIATSGCSVTTLAMVASYLTEHAYMPDELAGYLADFNGNNMQLLEYGADLLQLPCSKAENFHKALQALREGKVVIAMMGSNSLFTSGQHFIVLTGINEEGKIMVNDPNEANYSLWNLKNAFANGFKEGDICFGYSGAWIFDKDAMPEEPFIYVEEEVYIEPRYPEISLTESETELLARIVWLEARGESFEGQQAIAEIVFNRIISENFPNTVKSVIFAKGQFPTVAFLDTAEPTSVQYEAIERALSGPYVLPIDVFLFARTPLNSSIWGTIGGHTFCYSESPVCMEEDSNETVETIEHGETE